MSECKSTKITGTVLCNIVSEVSLQCMHKHDGRIEFVALVISFIRTRN